MKFNPHVIETDRLAAELEAAFDTWASAPHDDPLVRLLDDHDFDGPVLSATSIEIVVRCRLCRSTTLSYTTAVRAAETALQTHWCQPRLDMLHWQIAEAQTLATDLARTSRNDPDWWRHNYPQLVHQSDESTFVTLPWTPQDGNR